MNLSSVAPMWYAPPSISWTKVVMRDLRKKFFKFFRKSVPFSVKPSHPFAPRVSMKSIHISRVTNPNELRKLREMLEKDVRQFGGTASMYIFFSGDLIIMEVSSMPNGEVCTILESTDLMSMWAHSIRNPVN